MRFRRNPGRFLTRDRHGRLRGSLKIVLSDLQVRAVERLTRAGENLDEIALAIGVSRTTLFRRLNELPQIPRRGRGCHARRRFTVTPDELRQRVEELRMERCGSR